MDLKSVWPGLQGAADWSLEEQWGRLGEARRAVALAPDDEILGEILALQARPAPALCRPPALRGDWAAGTLNP